MSLHRHGRFHIGHRHLRHPRTWRADRVRLGSDFTKLWGAGVTSNLADGITFAALPLLSATLTRDPFLVALTAVVQSLPWFGFELVAGEIVDRSDRKKLMLWANLARGVLIATIAGLVAADLLELPILYVLAFAIGVAETLVDTSWEVMVPRLVDESNLEVAFGRSQAAEWTTNQLIGPPLGGFLFAAAAASPFFFDAGAFVFAALLIAWIPGTFRTERKPSDQASSVRRDIGEGIEWLWNHRILRALSLTAGISNLLGTATFAVFVLFAQEILELSDAGFGLVLAGSGVGGILGASVAHRIEKRFGPATLLVASMAGMGGTALAIALTSSPIVVGIAFAVEGFLIAQWNVISVSLRQALTPDELRGRVAADARTIAFGSIPIGAALGGILAEINLRAPFFLATGVYVLTVLVMSRVVTNQGIADMRAEAAGTAD